MSDSDEDDPVDAAAREAARARIALTARALAFLRKVPLLASTPASTLAALAAVAEHYSVARDEVIIQQGAPSDDGIFFIVRGSFRVVQELPVYTRATSEAAAAREFVLPPLSPEAAAAQRARVQVAEAQRSRQHSHAASPASSRASLLSTDTFLTAAAHRSAAPAAQDSAASMAAIREQQTEDEDEEYTELAAYDSHVEAKQQHTYARSGRTDSMRSPAPPLSQQLQSPSNASLPRSSKQSILVGSRFLDVNDLGPYAAFGEVGVMQRSVRTASVISRTSGGELFAITKFNFLRLQTKRVLSELREACANAYRTPAELSLELDDMAQWTAYRLHLLDVSRARDVRSHRQQQMPVFESVPVSQFKLTLPKLRTPQFDSSTSSNSYARRRQRGAPTSAAAPAPALSSPSLDAHRRTLSSYSDGSGFAIVEKYSGKRVTHAHTSGSSTARASGTGTTKRLGASGATSHR